MENTQSKEGREIVSGVLAAISLEFACTSRSVDLPQALRSWPPVF